MLTNKEICEMVLAIAPAGVTSSIDYYETLMISLGPVSVFVHIPNTSRSQNMACFYSDIIKPTLLSLNKTYAERKSLHFSFGKSPSFDHVFD
jgi:hypothetical protein